MATEARTREPVLHELPDDPLEIWETFYERGWCDGLPIIPPTPERVAAMLAGVAADPLDVVALLSPSHNPVTVEKIAVNAVMAGCVPGSVPILIAAVEGIAEPAFKFLPIGTTPATPAILLNGPIRHELGVNCSYSCMGGITRVNATLGRALRLIGISLGMGGARTILDQATTGLPNRISLCFGENEEASPWDPYHVERGFAADESTVTVVNVTWAGNMVDGESQTAESVMKTYAGSITYQGTNAMESGRLQPFLVLGPEHVTLFREAGMSKADIRERLWELAFLPYDNFPAEMQRKFAKHGRPIVDGRVHLTASPDDLQIVVAGGNGPHSVFMATLGVQQTLPIPAAG